MPGDPEPFELGAAFARGATSTVFRARWRSDGRPLAVKVGHGIGERHRLADEAETLASIDTKEVVSILGAGLLSPAAGEQSGMPYLALEWVDGGAVAPAKRRGSGDTRLASIVARDVGRALSSLHALDVAHGDVKPENVVLCAGSSAKLVDLGLADAAGRAVPRGGTPRYLAPECFSNEETGDGRARDLWALGALVAEIASEKIANLEDLRQIAPGDVPLEVAPLVLPLLSRAPGARPSADWTSRTASALLGAREGEHDPERHARAIRRTYLAARRPVLLGIARGLRVDLRVPGIAGEWLAEAAALFARIAELRGARASGERRVLADLDAFGRSRWLTSLVGTSAAAWPVPPVESDSELAERLLHRVRSIDPRSLSLADVAGTGPSVRALAPPDDPISLAVALGASGPSAAVLERAESYVATHPEAPPLVLALGTALRRAGEHGRALAVLGRCSIPEARVEAAECLRRAGDRSGARDAAIAAATLPLAPRALARCAAILGRLALDGGSPGDAKAALANHAETASTAEVRALSELAEGRVEAARGALAQGRSLADTDEERARLAAIAGNLHHAAGESERAFEAFAAAAEHAARAGAVIEEATYLTGLAAALFDAGRLSRSLEAATRATLLFENRGRAAEAARAMLARAAVFGAARAVPLVTEAAEDAIRRARAAGDTRCRAFAHLVLADALPPDASDGLEHARRAASLLEKAPEEDRLRAAARGLARGDDVAIPAFDAIAEAPGSAAPARLDWWGARAARLLAAQKPERADRVVTALGILASLPGPVASRGEALSAGARLAARLGDAEGARRLSAASAEAARILLDGAPPELRTSLLASPWLTELRPPKETGILPEQLGDVEALVRALGTRDRLRPLLDQVLDALVLWTGVERGLLLLRAPGDRLVPRAARNIARHDLHGTQLALSHSLAERALATGEPVVAVDAAGELPEVHESVHALKLRSVLAVPLIARGEPQGVVYLDDRVRRGAFGPGELSWVRLVAALAAVAIADARDQLALRRAARRAIRAEGKLKGTLARREAELELAERELARTREGRATRYPYDEIRGASAPMRALFALLDRVTPSEVPVLVVGESGSGKELVARAIHRNGPRRAAAFVSENCGAIPEGLLESVLFGHVRGAFTGANRAHAGLFELANGGTLFLDEIGEMSLGMQKKLLRVLEDGEVRPVGSERSRKVDVRVIAATHRDLAAMAEDGSFRQDLLYRLNVIRIDVPPLRERPGDTEILVRYFLEKHGAGRDVRLSRAALDLLTAFGWPGNIRQLENELRRALVLADDVVRPEHLSPEVREGGRSEAARRDGLNVRARVDSLETELVTTALSRTHGNQTRAAELLGLSRFGLQKMIRRLHIRVPSTPAGRDDAGAVTGER